MSFVPPRVIEVELYSCSCLLPYVIRWRGSLLDEQLLISRTGPSDPLVRFQSPRLLSYEKLQLFGLRPRTYTGWCLVPITITIFGLYTFPTLPQSATEAPLGRTNIPLCNCRNTFGFGLKGSYIHKSTCRAGVSTIVYISLRPPLDYHDIWWGPS